MRWAVLVAGFIILGAGVAMSFRDLVAASLGTYGAGVLCLIFAFLSRFKRFKGMGIEGELWEDKQEEAARIIDRLSRLAIATARPILAMAPRMNRTGRHLTRGELHGTVSTIESILREASISEGEIEALKHDYHRTTIFDMAQAIIKAIHPHIQKRLDVLSAEAAKLPQRDSDSEPQLRDLGRRQAEINEARRMLSFIPNDDDLERIPAKLEQAIRALPEFTADEKAALLEEHRSAFEELKYYAREKSFPAKSAWLRDAD